MDPELLRIYKESQALAKRLKSFLELDKDEMYGCVHQEIWEEYRRAADKAAALAGKLAQELIALQKRQ